MPSQRLYYNYQNERERLGLQGRFDWKPNDAVSAFVSTYYFDQSERSFRNDLNAAVQSSRPSPTRRRRAGRCRMSRRPRSSVAIAGSATSTASMPAPRAISAMAGAVMSARAGRTAASTTRRRSTPLRKVACNMPMTPAATCRSSRRSTRPLRAISALRRESSSRRALPAERGSLRPAGQSRLQCQGGGSRLRRDHRRALHRHPARGEPARTNYTGLPYTLASAPAARSVGFVCDTPIPTIDPGKVDALFAAARAGATATIDTAAQAAVLIAPERMSRRGSYRRSIARTRCSSQAAFASNIPRRDRAAPRRPTASMRPSRRATATQRPAVHLGRAQYQRRQQAPRRCQHDGQPSELRRLVAAGRRAQHDQQSADADHRQSEPEAAPRDQSRHRA